MSAWTLLAAATTVSPVRDAGPVEAEALAEGAATAAEAAAASAAESASPSATATTDARPATGPAALPLAHTEPPAPVQPTPWTLRLRGDDAEGSPAHAWAFFAGFVLFPLWWAAACAPIPHTRRVGGTDTATVSSSTADATCVMRESSAASSAARRERPVQEFTYEACAVMGRYARSGVMRSVPSG